MSWPGLPRLKGNAASSCFYSTALEKTQQFINKKCMLYNSPFVPIESRMKRCDGSQSDFTLHVSKHVHPILHENLNHIAEDIKLELSDIFADCSVVDNIGLKLTLRRDVSYRNGIGQLLSVEHFLISNSRGNILLLSYDDASTSLNNFRTKLIAEHISGIMLMNGYKLYCKDNNIRNIKSLPCCNNLILYSCEHCDQDSIYKTFEETCIKSPWYITNEENTILLDGKKYLKENLDRSSIYVEKSNEVCLQKGSLFFKESAYIYHVLTAHVDHNIDYMLSIVPMGKRLFVQQCSLVLEMIMEDLPKNFHLVHQDLLHSCKETSFNLYQQQRHSEMEQALVQKYGAGILNDETWQSVIETITETAVKFDFLFTGFANPLRLDHCNSEFNIDNKGSFVQYNCARLATLFKHYNEKLKAGMYQPIPPVEQVDFSQLKLQEEWQLFFNYVLPFAANVNSLSEQLQDFNSLYSSIPTHRVCQFLSSLSRDLSIYYNRHRVLVEPYPQLVVKMYPRLYLLQAIHKVMKICLALLNLPAVEKM